MIGQKNRGIEHPIISPEIEAKARALDKWDVAVLDRIAGRGLSFTMRERLDLKTDPPTDDIAYAIKVNKKLAEKLELSGFTYQGDISEAVTGLVRVLIGNGLVVVHGYWIVVGSEHRPGFGNGKYELTREGEQIRDAWHAIKLIDAGVAPERAVNIVAVEKMARQVAGDAKRVEKVAKALGKIRSTHAGPLQGLARDLRTLGEELT